MEKEPRRGRLSLTAAVALDYPAATEILVSFPDEWELIERMDQGRTPLYVAAMPMEHERPSRDHFHGLPPEINLELTHYRLYRFFQPWPMPTVLVAWNIRTGVGRVEQQGNLTVQLRPRGQAQVWFGQHYAVLWECYLDETARSANWQDELSALWRVVERDVGVNTLFSPPYEPTFAVGYTQFLSRMGYSPVSAHPAWWSKARDAM